MLAAALAVAAPAAAQTAGSTAQAGPGSELTRVDPAFPVGGRALEPQRVLAIARATPQVRGERGPLTERVYTRARGGWQVSFDRGSREVAQVVVADDNGTVLEAWTGVQVQWPMARGYPGAFGRAAAALPVWLIGLALFLAPFARPPWRMVHLDLLVVAAFSISLACFSDGNVDASVPLAYPPLLYLLARLLHLARASRPPVPLALNGARLLGAGIVFLVGFRLALQGVSANVIDVGYAGVIGADRITDGADLYGSFPADNPRGDTYGPLLYLSYVPFELLAPWSGTWDDLPAAHAAAAVFDLLCAAGLYVVGRRRSPTHGLLLAYLWLACPLTLFIANSGAHDALIGALVLGAVAWPAAAGALAAAATLTKFAPAVLLPLLVRTRRDLLAAASVLATAAALVLALDGGFSDFWRSTIQFQVDRESPFSVWGLYDLPGVAVAQAAVVVLAVVVARRGGDRYALAAALLVAVQLTAVHWFYLYLGWLLPVALAALLAPYAPASERSTGSIEAAEREDSLQRTSTALSHGSSVAVP